MVCGTGGVRWRAPFGSGTKSRVCKAFLDKSQALPGRSVGMAFAKMADQGHGFRARTRCGGKSKGRSERLPTGPCPLHQECPAITCDSCHSKTTTVCELYNDQVTEGKTLALSFRDSLPFH